MSPEVLHAQGAPRVPLDALPRSLIPFWLAMEMRFHRKQYEALSAVLTRRSLRIQRGVIGEVQRSVACNGVAATTQICVYE